MKLGMKNKIRIKKFRKRLKALSRVVTKETASIIMKDLTQEVMVVYKVMIEGHDLSPKEHPLGMAAFFMPNKRRLVWDFVDSTEKVITEDVFLGMLEAGNLEFDLPEDVFLRSSLLVTQTDLGTLYESGPRTQDKRAKRDIESSLTMYHKVRDNLKN